MRRKFLGGRSATTSLSGRVNAIAITVPRSVNMPPRALLPLLLLSALPSARAWGLCNDKNPACGHWAKTGECDGKNSDFMKKTCPHSCGTCHLICRDVEEACGAWAKAGHCESNADFMFKTCPTSCGICAAKCYDKEPEKCGEWARGGECTKNPSILSTCPVSCGVCSSVCLDKHNDCPGWAAAGDCSKNREYMLRTCPNACSLCDEEKHKTTHCENRNQKQCLLWGEHECSANPISMLELCPALCGACTVACVDKNTDCPGWAKHNEGKECDNNAFLQSSCPSSCGVCAGIHVAKPPEKDEI